MSAITQCPECDTRFKVSQTQLEAHQGIVRCGHCEATFDALHYLHQEEPSPQIPLPIDIVDSETLGKAASNANERNSSNIFPKSASTHGKTPLVASPLTLTRQFSALKSVDLDPNSSSGGHTQKKAWLWTLGSLLLIIVLLAQTSYFFRVEIAARLPGSKPMLDRYCVWLRCSIPLPKNPKLISIESSNLEASSSQANVIALNVTLRNRATHSQAFPSLELTLTDASDTAIARKVFPPEAYLTPDTDSRQGLRPTRELQITLHLDSSDLRPTGYRLFLFYP